MPCCRCRSGLLNLTGPQRGKPGSAVEGILAGLLTDPRNPEYAERLEAHRVLDAGRRREKITDKSLQHSATGASSGRAPCAPPHGERTDPHLSPDARSCSLAPVRSPLCARLDRLRQRPAGGKPSCPFHAELPQCVELLRGEPVSPRASVRYPYAQLDGHRFRLAVDGDL